MYQLLQDFFPIILLPTNSPNCCTHQGEHGKQIHLQQLQLNRSERAAERLHQTHPPAIKRGFSSRVFTTAVSSREARPATRLLLVSMGDFMGFPGGPWWSAPANSGLSGPQMASGGFSSLQVIAILHLLVIFQRKFLRPMVEFINPKHRGWTAQNVADCLMVGRPWNSHGFKPQPHKKYNIEYSKHLASWTIPYRIVCSVPFHPIVFPDLDRAVKSNSIRKSQQRCRQVVSNIVHMKKAKNISINSCILLHLSILSVHWYIYVALKVF